MLKSCYNSYLEIDSGTVIDNYRRVKKHIGDSTDIIPVIKCGAYGMGTVEMAKILIDYCAVEIIATAQVYESLQIREAGYRDIDLLVLGGTPFHAIPIAVENDLQLAVYNTQTIEAIARAAKEQNKQAKIQVKIETGLNRIGVKPGKPLEELLDSIDAAENLEITGVFTQFSDASTTGGEFALEQYPTFVNGFQQLKGRGIKPRYVHTCNSRAALWFKEAYFTHVRTGSLCWGYLRSDDGNSVLGISEAASWRAFVTGIHEVFPGESVGYERYFRPEKPTVVATISIGYGDGLYRPLVEKRGPVYVNNSKTRYLGSCMDQTFIDVTDIGCNLGDEVTIWGYTKGGETLSLYELEKLTGPGVIYPFCSISNRVFRIYK